MNRKKNDYLIEQMKENTWFNITHQCIDIKIKDKIKSMLNVFTEWMTEKMNRWGKNSTTKKQTKKPKENRKK